MAEMHEPLNDAKHIELDSTLDAALARYAAVEPRPGLEERVLANLRAERAQVPDRSRWRVYCIAWSMVGALAAVVVVVVALAWRSGKPSHPVITDHSSAPAQVSKEPATLTVSNGDVNQVRTDPIRPQARAETRRTPVPHSQLKVVMAENPKLDQFPSPRPLTEEEKLALDYVQQFPEEASLIARAQAASDQEKELKKNLQPSTELPGSEKQE